MLRYLFIISYIQLVLFLPVSLSLAALDICDVGDYQHGSWKIEDPNKQPTGNFSCISGRYQYYYWDGHLGGFNSCQARIDYYIPSQFPVGSKSCGVDVNPCGGVMIYFQAGENCCVEMPGARYVWTCNDDPAGMDTKKNQGRPPCPLSSQ